MNIKTLNIAALFGIIVLLALFSFFLLDRPMWLDEINTLLYVKRPWSEMIELTKYDFSPPFYYIILKAWITLTNNTSEWVLRVPSLLFGIASGIVFFFFSKKWFTRSAAWASVIVFFASFTLTHYFFEVRMYSLFMFLGIISTYFLFQMLFYESKNRKIRILWWSGFLAASVAGTYTHYAYWFFLAGQNLAVFFFIWKKEISISRIKWLMSQLFLVVLYIPWWKIFFSQLYHTQFSSSQYWTAAAGIKSRFFIEDFILSSFISPFETNLIITTVIKLLILLAGVLFFICISVEKDGKIAIEKKSPSLRGVSLFIIGITPIIFLWVVDIYLVRYVLVVFPFFILLVCYCLLTLQPKKIALLMLGLLIILSLSSTLLSIQHESQTPERQWIAISQFIKENSDNNTTTAIVVPYVLTSRAFSYYYKGNLPVFDAFPPSLILEKEKEFLYKTYYIGMPVIESELDIADLKEKLQNFQEVWFIEYLPDNKFADPHDIVFQYLLKRFQNKEELFPLSSFYELRLVKFY